MNEQFQTDHADQSYIDHNNRRGSSQQKTLWIIVGILGVVAIGIVAWIIVSSFSDGATEELPTPTPQSMILETPMPTPTESSETADKKDLTVEILNGTGIAKEASVLQEKLKNLGYETIETGNANSKDYDIAQVTFYSTFPESLKKELVDMLEDTYTEVKQVDKTGESTIDVQIITGLRPGISRPSATPKPTTEAKESSPSASPQ